MTKSLIEYFSCPRSCSSILQILSHLIVMSARGDRHFYYYSSFADQETEAGCANWPRVTCRGNGGAACRFWAAWLIHTRVVQVTWSEGGTFWAKEAYHLTEVAGIDRARVKGEASGTYWKGPQCWLKALGLDQEGSWRNSEWTYQEENVLPTTWGDRSHRGTWQVLQSNHWCEFGLSHHFCFSLVAV